VNDTAKPGPYDLFALALSVFGLVLLGLRAIVPLDVESQRLFQQCDLLLCAFFFLDFLRNIARAENRWRYLRGWGLLDLAASIPAADYFRLGRVGRVVRILRVIRIIKIGRLLAAALATRRRESAIWAALLVAVLVIFTGAIAELEFERETGNIKTAEDALWWAMTTITTVGYGDRYPTTTEGRLVAAGLMAVGVGLFGTLSGVAASWFTQPDRRE
jgi:voltage-gated potassium channel